MVVPNFVYLLHFCFVFLFVVSPFQYSVLIFVVLGIQMAMGIYLTTLNVNSVRATWEEDDGVGQQR